MTIAQQILIVGGVFNLFLGTLAAYVLYWVRVNKPDVPAQRYGMTTHKVTLWNGFLLLGLAVAIPHTGFVPALNTTLAGLEVLATLLSDGRNILSWYRGMEDEFAQGGEFRRRLIGFGNLIHVLVQGGILYGITRTFLGI